jgi:hypothetical protein
MTLEDLTDRELDDRALLAAALVISTAERALAGHADAVLLWHSRLVIWRECSAERIRRGSSLDG